MKSKIKAMLHPIRMRIIQALLDGHEMTAGEMAEKLQDRATIIKVKYSIMVIRISSQKEAT